MSQYTSPFRSPPPRSPYYSPHPSSYGHPGYGHDQNQLAYGHPGYAHHQGYTGTGFKDFVPPAIMDNVNSAWSSAFSFIPDILPANPFKSYNDGGRNVPPYQHQPQPHHHHHQQPQHDAFYAEQEEEEQEFEEIMNAQKKKEEKQRERVLQSPVGQKSKNFKTWQHPDMQKLDHRHLQRKTMSGVQGGFGLFGLALVCYLFAYTESFLILNWAAFFLKIVFYLTPAIITSMVPDFFDYFMVPFLISSFNSLNVYVYYVSSLVFLLAGGMVLYQNYNERSDDFADSYLTDEQRHFMGLPPLTEQKRKQLQAVRQKVEAQEKKDKENRNKVKLGKWNYGSPAGYASPDQFGSPHFSPNATATSPFQKQSRPRDGSGYVSPGAKGFQSPHRSPMIPATQLSPTMISPINQHSGMKSPLSPGASYLLSPTSPQRVTPATGKGKGASLITTSSSLDKLMRNRLKLEDEQSRPYDNNANYFPNNTSYGNEFPNNFALQRTAEPQRYNLISGIPNANIKKTDNQFQNSQDNNQNPYYRSNKAEYLLVDKLKIINKMEKWTENMKEWIAGGPFTDLLKNLSQLQLNSLPPIVQLYLSVTNFPPNNNYVQQRITDLSKFGTNLAHYAWNGGGSKWNQKIQNLPTDAQLVFHVFCTFLDVNMLNPLLKDTFRSFNREFTDHFTCLDPDQLASKKKDASKDIMIIQTGDIANPHYNICVRRYNDDERLNEWENWEIEQGRNNLFHCLIVFLYYVKTRMKGHIGSLDLGSKRISLLQVIAD